jgi:cytochrome b561
MFSLLLEYCRLRFKRRALGFVALWLFVLCLLPFILAGVFSSGALAKLSFLAPGTVALTGSGSDDLKYLVGWTFIHFGIVVLLFVAWRRQWKLLIATPPPLPPAR